MDAGSQINTTTLTCTYYAGCHSAADATKTGGQTEPNDKLCTISRATVPITFVQSLPIHQLFPWSLIRTWKKVEITQGIRWTAKARHIGVIETSPDRIRFNCCVNLSTAGVSALGKDSTIYWALVFNLRNSMRK
ncbi:hypothetical protein B0H13DRAFT_1904797 [Mycena leptocephala]|nr:hypothetical protein B0H13DRAFT_1904797 [Mycena leptocephala]